MTMATLTVATIDHPTQDRASALPVPHDFPFATCSVCRFPIPQWDLAGGEYEHRHASTCATTHESDQADRSDRAGLDGAQRRVGGLP
jgi:hypothetical protein